MSAGRSYIAGRDSVLAGDADVVLVDVEGELQGAGQVGDGVHRGVSQHLTDTVRLVSWLPCSNKRRGQSICTFLWQSRAFLKCTISLNVNKKDKFWFYEMAN